MQHRKRVLRKTQPRLRTAAQSQDRNNSTDEVSGVGLVCLSMMCLLGVLPGVIVVGVTIKLVGGFKIQWPFLKLLQKRLILLHHSQLQRRINKLRFVHYSIVIFVCVCGYHITWSLLQSKLRRPLLMDERMKCKPWSAIRKFRSPRQNTTLCGRETEPSPTA